MTTAPVAVEADAATTVAEAAMLLVHSRHVPVLRSGQLVGILSVRDLLAAQLSSLSADDPERRERAHRVTVAEVMTPNPLCVGPEDQIQEAAARLHGHQISCAPVVRHGELVGILTTQDLVRHARELLRVEAEEIGATPTVARLMTPSPVTTIQQHEHLDLARVLMKTGGFRHLPVMSGTRLVGLLSDRDLLVALASQATRDGGAGRLCALASVEAGAVMTPSPVAVTPEDPAVEAADKLLKRKLDALPIVRASRLVGMLSEMDFLSYLIAL
jgi:CBS domain-containing membrane protein